jgi:cell division protein FtsB
LGLSERGGAGAPRVKKRFKCAARIHSRVRLMFDSFPKKVFHLRKRQKAYTYELKIEIDAHAAEFASCKPSRKQIEAEAKRLRRELERNGWKEAVHPLTGKPFPRIVEDYFKNVVEGLKELKRAA